MIIFWDWIIDRIAQPIITVACFFQAIEYISFSFLLGYSGLISSVWMNEWMNERFWRRFYLGINRLKSVWAVLPWFYARTYIMTCSDYHYCLHYRIIGAEFWKFRSKFRVRIIHFLFVSCFEMWLLKFRTTERVSVLAHYMAQRIQ